jgi:hypothetical protein
MSLCNSTTYGKGGRFSGQVAPQVGGYFTRSAGSLTARSSFSGTAKPRVSSIAELRMAPIRLADSACLSGALPWTGSRVKSDPDAVG